MKHPPVHFPLQSYAVTQNPPRSHLPRKLQKRFCAFGIVLSIRDLADAFLGFGILLSSEVGKLFNSKLQRGLHNKSMGFSWMYSENM